MRTKRILSIFVALCMLLSLFPMMVSAASTPTLTTDKYDINGDGVNDSVYEITTVAQLQWFANQLPNGYSTEPNAILLNDLDLSSVCSESLGSWNAITAGYLGTFDGNGKTIRNLYINSTSDRQGLFGMLYCGTIKNLTVTGTVTGTEKVAGFVGHGDVSLYNCVNHVDVTVTNRCGAGFIGYQGTNSVIDRCVNYGDITCTGDKTATIGGIVGQFYGGVRNCANFGTISSPNGSLVAGIAGDGYPSGTTVENCINLGTVSAKGVAVEITYDCKTVTNCCYSKDSANSAVYKYANATVTDVEGRSLDEFASGAVAYALGDAWGQEIGVDPMPVLGGMKVYAGVSCTNGAYVYTNSELTTVHDEEASESEYTNGICNNCGAYIAVAQNADGYYEIGNAGQLLRFAEMVNSGELAAANAVLTADIELPAETAWTPIGVSSRPYTGSFDGDGFTVDFGSQNVTSGDYGLFGYINGATVANVAVNGSFTIAAKCDGVAGVVGHTVGTSYITGCNSHVDIQTNDGGASSLKIAGIVAKAESTPYIDRCANYGTITANNAYECIAGIAAYGQKGKITNCVNYGTISASSAQYVAGILGYVNYNEFEGVQNCLNAGTITGGTYGGDIVGYLRKHVGSSVLNNYYSGNTAFGGVEYSSKNPVATKVDDAQLASGEVTYLLNGDQSDIAWFQTCGEGLPALSGEVVYQVPLCDGENVGYRNVDEELTHILDADGLCSVCGETYVATLNGTYYHTLAEAIIAANTLTNRGSVDADAQLVLLVDATLTYSNDTSAIWEGTTFTINEGVTLTVDSLTIRDVLTNNGTINGFAESSMQNGSSLSLNLNYHSSGAQLYGNGTYNIRIYSNGGTIYSGIFNEEVDAVGVINGGAFHDTVTASNVINGGTFEDIILKYNGAIHYSSDAVTINGSVYEYIASGTTAVTINGEAHTHTEGETTYCNDNAEQHTKFVACTTCPFTLYMVTEEEHTYTDGYCDCDRPEGYNIYVGGVEITVANASDVLGDGTVSYDPTTSTLTLNNVNIVDAEMTIDDSTTAVGIYTELSLNLVLIGDNYVSSDYVSVAVYAKNGLNISGSGSLTVEAGMSAFAYAIAAQNLSIAAESTVAANGLVLALALDVPETFHAVVQTQEGPGRYEVYGDAVLNQDLTVDGNNDPGDSYATFTILEGATLTISNGVTLTIADSSNLTESEDEKNQIINNGTIVLEGDATIFNNGEGICTEAATHCYGNEFACLVCGSMEEATAVDGVYQITNAAQLYWFANFVNSGTSDADAILMNDIVVNSDMTAASLIEWTPIASDVEYTGTFDGNGYTVSGLYMNGEYGNVGLVGNNGGTVKNVGVTNSSFTTTANSASVGGVVGSNSGTVSCCWFDGEITTSGSDTYAGGVVGYNGYEKLTENCYNLGNITNKYNGTGTTTVGGVVGHNFAGTVKNCFSNGTVSNAGGSSTARVGAAIGCNFGFNYGSMGVGYALAENCYAPYGDLNAIGYSATTNTTATNVDLLYGDEMTSGELAYMLNADASSSVWGQTIGKDQNPVIGGKTVYQVLACDNATTIYSNTNESGQHSYEDGVCEICGADENADYVLDESLKFTMSISVGAEMTVSYNIMGVAVNSFADFYLEVKKDVAGGDPITTVYGITADREQMTAKVNPATGEALMYQVTYRGINAKEMGDNFSTTLYAVAEDGTVYCGKTTVSSIKSYLVEKIDASSSIAELKTMCVDMLKYGAAAQVRLGYNTENLVTADLTEDQLAYATQEIPEAVDYAASTGSGANVNTNITVTSRVQLNLSCIYTTATDPSAIKCVITDSEGKVLAEIAATNKNNVMFSAIYENVGAKEMRDVINATFYEGNTAISKTVSWSVESYVAQVRAKTNVTEDELNMVNAMLVYGDAVAAYMAVK